jgi:hypothetical protein
MTDEVYLNIIDKSENAVLDRFFICQAIYRFKMLANGSGVKIFAGEKINVDRKLIASFDNFSYPK